MSQLPLCSLSAHQLSRRKMLGTMGGLSLASLAHPAIAREMEQKEKQVLLLWLDGGMSQLESWDPKPNTRFGGPFRSIPTALPGVHVSELMPGMAARLDQIAVVRSMQTEDPNHSSGVGKILRGHPKNRGVVYPFMGSAVAKLMGPCQSQLPPYLWVKPGNGGFITKHAGFLGAKYGALALGDGKPPDNLIRPDFLTEDADRQRNELREMFNQRYSQEHRKEFNEANHHVFQLARSLMKQQHLFDESQLPEEDRQRYGTHDFGRHVHLSLRLLEAGVRFIQVTSYGWDSHGDNFNAHASRVPKVDQACSALFDDLKDRGMLDHVLVIIMAEFGRTPRVNGAVGRDHWPNAWSLATFGCGIRPGVVVGETNPEGTDILTEPYDIGYLFHTWYKALGIDSSHTEFMNGTQPLPIAHDDHKPIAELLA